MNNDSNIQRKITHSRSKSSISMDIDILDDVSSEDEAFKPITEIMKHIINNENLNDKEYEVQSQTRYKNI